MPRHNFDGCRGRIETFSLESFSLEGNLLGDPSRRLVHVYLPEGYDESNDRYPLFLALAAFTGSGAKLLAWQAFGESLPERIDRLVAEGKMGKVVCVLPDCFTSLGGNQYVDSPVLGQWASYLFKDLVPAIEQRYRVRRGRQHRALFGKSSGGYGALAQGMTQAEHWGAVACHAGDMGFEWCYLGDFPRALAVLSGHDGDPKRFLEHVASAISLRGEEIQTLMSLAMAASYAPDDDAPLGISLPVDPHTCQLDVSRWARWLDHDPVRMVRFAQVQENLRRLDGLYIDCGRRDEYNLVYGARQLSRALQESQVPHRYEEFDGGHRDMDHRLDVSLPFLWAAVSGQIVYDLQEQSGRCGDGAAALAPAEDEARPAIAPPGGVPGGCPKCRVEPMRQEVHGGVEIDRCPVCKGIFLDRGELESVFSTDIARSIDDLSSSGVAEMLDHAIAWCVRCGGEMGPVRTIAGVLLNVCDRCGTVFLDQGELAALDLFRS